MTLVRLTTIAALALASACVNPVHEREARERAQRIDQMQGDLDSQIGRMTAEQAVARWGILTRNSTGRTSRFTSGVRKPPFPASMLAAGIFN